jgi:hypothetical protein
MEKRRGPVKSGTRSKRMGQQLVQHSARGKGPARGVVAGKRQVAKSIGGKEKRRSKQLSSEDSSDDEWLPSTQIANSMCLSLHGNLNMC